MKQERRQQERRQQERGQQRPRHGKRLAVWLLAVVLAVTMTMPGASYAVTASTQEPSANNSAAQDQATQEPSANNPATQEPATQEPAEDLLNRGLENETQPDPQSDPQVESESEPAMRAESEPAPEPEPEPEPEPQYFSVYRIEVDDSGVMRCWWYDADGVKSEEPQKDAYFIVRFDAGSTTAGSAVVKVGKTGTLYYFNKNGKGKKYTGWFKQSGSKYYFKKGSRYLGTKKVKKTWYQFSKKNGKMIRRIGDGVDKKVQPYTSKTRYMIIVKLKEHRVRIYKGKKNAWKRVHKFKCTTGKSSTPTVRGTFTVGSKGLYFNTGNTLRCWYYTQFCGNYLFHSVIYDRSSRPTHVVDGRLGISASHGCVRLALKNAKWIYNNIPRGTKVVVY